MPDPNVVNYIAFTAIGVGGTVGAKLIYDGLKSFKNGKHNHNDVAKKSDIYNEDHSAKFLTEKRHDELCALASSGFMGAVRSEIDDSNKRQKKDYFDPKFQELKTLINSK